MEIYVLVRGVAPPYDGGVRPPSYVESEGLPSYEESEMGVRARG